MTWLVWRQHRVHAAIGLALLAAFAAVLVITGLAIAAHWHTLLTGCTASARCGNLRGTVSLGENVAGHDLVILSLAAPAVFGMLVGAPLLAHEFEARTTDFAWAQSVTRARWLLVKVGWLLLAAALWGGVIAALVTWWSGPSNAFNQNAFQPNFFDMQGLVPVGYAVFATALGIAAGALVRRTLPAIAIVFGGFIGLRLLISLSIRSHYMAAVTTYYGLTGNFTPAPGSWVLGNGIISKSGQVISARFSEVDVGGVPLSALPASCQKLLQGAPLVRGGPLSGAKHALLSCVQSAGFRQYLTYQPASRYWAFQGIETGIFVAFAACLVALTYFVIGRRDA